MIQHARVLILSVGLALSGLSTPAHANNSRYAAFVVEENSGVVLHSRRSEAERYPASLTKMMTLYMLFEALEMGEIGLNDPIRISANAANASPSRLGLSAGSTISAENAIRALVVKSANDVAVAVGERLGGGESRFGELMTARAAGIGLTNTTFRNASGLPNSRQTTTARDMARLAIALHRDFPQYFDYFNEESFRYNGRTYRNHNSLVGRVRGVDGLKTGYIRASGFNVVVSAERDDHRLITVIMGGPSAAARDAHAEELIEAAFATLEQRQDTRLFAALSSPRINPVRQQDLIALDVAALHLSEPVEMGSADQPPALQIVLADEDEMRVDTLAPVRDRPAAARSGSEPIQSQGSWAIQVGAYNTADAAHDRLAEVAIYSGALGSAQPAARAVTISGDRLWRARFENLTEDSARLACRDLSARSHPCFAVAPGR
ncbi:D-alanyl-D-alanine carboxypeptidase [Maricaulis sp.]|uniref:D-alanyl-D-alanine carboxypeptidase n=1 Tax=Maricaulis sp. TaxID=1486257 RepID=UPI002B26B5B2|nr:D-alanyl-D-alanine carboxypeptidase [Maricaulis sp.]